MELQLESPLETILFGFSSTVACFIWAFITLLAAAFGLWRLRSPLPKPAYSSATPAAPMTPKKISPDPAIVWAERSDDSYSGEEGFPKGIFTACFCDEGELDGSEENVGGMRMGNGDNEGFDLLGFGWRGDLGWYRCQDRTAINGSVVRLWDSDKGGVAADKKLR